MPLCAFTLSLLYLLMYILSYQFITSMLYWLQILFGVLYIVNLAMVLFIYLKTDVVWNLIHHLLVMAFMNCFHSESRKVYNHIC